MLELEEKEPANMLIKYIYESTKYEAVVKIDKWGNHYAELQKNKGKLIGAMVSIGSGVVGWSLCNKKDKYKFSKELALDIAFNRAFIIDELSKSKQKEYYNKVPMSIKEDVDRMLERSEKYFK